MCDRFGPERGFQAHEPSRLGGYALRGVPWYVTEITSRRGVNPLLHALLVVEWFKIAVLERLVIMFGLLAFVLDNLSVKFVH